MIRVLVGDSHPVVYVGLGAILRAESDIELVGQAHDGLEVLQLAATIDPDVILMELRLPRIDGLAVLRNLAARPHRGKVVVFTGSEDREEFVVALRLGCAGILMKSSKPELIAKSIQKVYEGEIWLDADMTAAVMRNLAMPSQTGAAPGRYRKAPRSRTQLSQREQEIMVLIAQGCKNKEIAEKMFIGEQTVKNHLHNMFEKLGVSDRLGLALYAVHNNLHVDATARRVRSWGED